MPTFYDSRNQPHELSERLGGGGEGTVYACENYNLVAKIYHEPITEEKAEKLRWMAANKNQRLLKVAAWVVDVLHKTPDGEIVGFLMPNVKAKEIHELYSLKSRRVYFPDATWHFLVHTAANLARAFHNLHRDAHIMGDVNHGNCVVMRDGTVKLIDCDSYSIKTDKMRYACEVGVATHLAPELQGVNLRHVERLDRHDNFGLAVIIFQLLFLGRHPFAGNYFGSEDKSLEDCIRERLFAYGSSAEMKNVRQPPGTLRLSAMPTRISEMFERAFLTENRPEAREWIEALEDLSLNLEQCSLHPGHLYFNKLKNCPWCEIEAQTGLMLFPFVTSGSHLNGEKPFNIFTIENLISSLGIQNTLSIKPNPLPPDAVLPSSPEIIEARQNGQKLTFFVVPAHLFVLILLMWLLGIGAAFYLGIVLSVFLIVFLNNLYKSVRQPLEETLTDNQRKWERIEQERTRTGVPQFINNDLIKIRKKISDYQSVQRKSVIELKLLQTNVARQEFYKYLRSKKISAAEISGITALERKHLIAAGVRTAAEIEENRLRHFYKINDETILKLLEWRGQILIDFDKSEQTDKVIKAEQTRFISETNGERRLIERDIEQLLMLLRAGAVHLHKQQRQIITKSEDLAKQISQAKSDLQMLGSNLPAAIVLILITLFAPLFAMFTGLNTPEKKSDSPFYSQNTDSFNYSQSPPEAVKSYPKPDLQLPDENITEAEISDLPESERKMYAENLYSEAVTYNYDNIDRQKAERDSRQALRFAAKDPRLLNQLGYALHGQEKYAESLKYLNQSLAIEKNNIETKIFISMNYLATKRFNDSAKIMNEAVKENPNSFEGFYSLGLAYSGLKNYGKAEAAFRRAAKIKPSDADIHYQLGYVLYKLKKRHELRDEYETLAQLNEDTAQRLMTDTNLEIIQSVNTIESSRETK